MKIKARRVVERPFSDKRLLRVYECIDKEVKHAWLVRMTDDGGQTIKKWDKGDEKPDWLSDPEPTCPRLLTI